MMLDLHIEQALLVERAIFIAATIIVFGVISIGGLYLLRRTIGRPPHVRAEGEAAGQQVAPDDTKRQYAELDRRLGEMLELAERADKNVRAALAARLLAGEAEREPRSEIREDIQHQSES